jgi:DNA-binding NarL/FixJ family response regulator
MMETVPASLAPKFVVEDERQPYSHTMTTIGLVEDNRELRASLERMVNAAPGYRCVCVCSTAEDALREMPAAQPEVVLMDIHLPNRSGIECTRRLRDLCPAIQVLILTVYDDNENILNALKAGASGYLLKRSSAAEILHAISEVKEGGAPMSTQIARKVVASLREPTADPAANAEALSERELEVLGYMSKGYSEKEIADKMHVSVNTIKTHRKHVYHKLHIRCRAEILLRFRA